MGKVKGIFASNISGRVGNVVFRKNGKANVVSQRPAAVKNPRTNLQQIQRAYIKSVTSAYSVFCKICDHSFEGVSYGARSMNFFNKVNYPVVSGARKAVFKNSDSVVVPVAFIMSKGSITWNGSLKDNGVIADISQYMANNKVTNIANFEYSQLLEALNLKVGDQITVINVKLLDRTFTSQNGLVSQNANSMSFARYILKSADGTTKAFVADGGEASGKYKLNPDILAEDSLMSYDAEIKISSKGSFSIETSGGDNPQYYTAIISRKNGDKWLRSNATLYVSNEDTSYDISNVLSSYMPSDEPYLNAAEN